jgi:flagellar basal-body rod protein FlgB
MDLFGESIPIMEKALTIRSEKNRVIASNIANQDTPGYRAKDLNFGEALRMAGDASGSGELTVTHSAHLGGTANGASLPAASEVPDTLGRLDENTVNAEMEMAKLAENQVNYNASIEFISEKFKLLRYSITEGK